MKKLYVKEALFVFGQNILIFDTSQVNEFPEVGDHITLLDIYENCLGFSIVKSALPTKKPELHSITLEMDCKIKELDKIFSIKF